MRKEISNKRYIPDEKAWEQESVFFRKYTSNVNSKFHIDESDLIPSVGKVIEIIKRAGGLVFIPHIYQYEENSIRILEELINNYDIDGIECYYPDFTEEQTKFLLDFCRNNNKYISGGTDYHGSDRPNIQLGIGLGKLDIDYETVKKWARNYLYIT